MNALKNIVFSALAFVISLESAFAAIGAGDSKLSDSLKGRSDNLETGVQSIATFITNLLYLIAVGYALYGGFLILTDGGNEEGVKKGKKILINAALGLLVIFLASSIVSFVLRLITA